MLFSFIEQQGELNMPDSLERIYRAVPVVNCQGICQEACGPIDMSDEERRRIAERGVDIPPPTVRLNSVCPALVDGRCSVYDVRPLICRLWGAVESMPCPWGCADKLLMDEGAQALIRRSVELG